MSDEEKSIREELDEDAEALEEAEELVEAGLEGHQEGAIEHLDKDTDGAYSEAEEKDKGFGSLEEVDGEITPD